MYQTSTIDSVDTGFIMLFWSCHIPNNTEDSVSTFYATGWW